MFYQESPNLHKTYTTGLRPPSNLSTEHPDPENPKHQA